jgi:hypothetical protein
MFWGIQDRKRLEYITVSKVQIQYALMLTKEVIKYPLGTQNHGPEKYRRLPKGHECP